MYEKFMSKAWNFAFFKLFGDSQILSNPLFPDKSHLKNWANRWIVTNSSYKLMYLKTVSNTHNECEIMSLSVFSPL